MDYIVKFQLEIRFERIMSFHTIIREIADNFVNFYEKLSIANQGRFDEIFIFDLKDENTKLDFYYDKAIIISEGKESDFKDENFSHNKLFYDMLDYLIKFKLFKKIKNQLINIEGITTLPGDNVTNTSKLSEFFLTNKNNQVMKDFNDFNITLEKGSDKDKSISITFGPYEHKDLVKRTNYEKNKISKYIKTEDVGLMYYLKHFCICDNYDFHSQKQNLNELLVYKKNLLKLIN